jgi:hypothetical protein
MAAQRRQAKAGDGFARETFTQPREQARRTARAFLDRWPAAAYMSAVESWRELPGGEIEFTMKRLRVRIDGGPTQDLHPGFETVQGLRISVLPSVHAGFKREIATFVPIWNC